MEVEIRLHPVSRGKTTSRRWFWSFTLSGNYNNMPIANWRNSSTTREAYYSCLRQGDFACRKLKLVTFEEPHYHRERLGFWIGNEHVVDANFAYARMLKDQGEDYPIRFANAFVPPHLLRVLQGGKKSMNALRETLKFVEDTWPTKISGPLEEESVFDFSGRRSRRRFPGLERLSIPRGTFVNMQRKVRTLAGSFQCPTGSRSSRAQRRS